VVLAGFAAGMSKARLVITAVTAENRPVSEVARSYGVSRSWIYELLARYQAEGEAAFEPRSRRPGSCPSAVSPGTVELIARLRKELAGQGLDAGPHTIAWHLARHHHVTVSPATVSRYLARLGLVTPDPAKRPRSSYIRFEAEMPNQCWQSDFTHYPLDGGPGAEILTWLDDHSRYALSVTAHRRVTAADVLAAFQAASGRHGTPAATLTDNGMVFTTRRHGRGSNLLEAELRRRGVQQKNGKPNHPQTQGKVERFQQTLKKWLAARPAQPAAIAALQALLDEFTDLYNTRRPHRSLPHQAVPATAYAGRPKATPGPFSHAPDQQVRIRTTDQDGKILLSLNGRRHHIATGRQHARTRVLILLSGLDTRIINAATSELIRELTVNPDRDYQPTGQPPGRRKNQHPK
jgi:transposase InsO family protein